MIRLSYSQNMIIIMIHDHNKIIINIGQMIKLQWLKQTKNCESIILNHRWTDIELILNKTYEHDKLIMINLPPMLVER
jgi:phosphopantetheinyl transferase